MASTAASSTPPAGFKMIKEGTASILYEANEEAGDKGEPVFYNKVQVFNRDLSIRMISLFTRVRAREKAAGKGNRAGKRAAFAAKKAAEAAAAAAAAAEAGAAAAAVEVGAAASSSASSEPPQPAAADVLAMSGPELDAHLRAQAAEGKGGIKVLDALAATGLRSVRYFKEIPGVAQVVTNDLDPAAVRAAERNVAFNGLTLDQVSPHQGDANLAMLTATEKFDVIDLDPYGSAAPFLDSAVQAVADGGLLCITCTDMAVLSGNQPEACFAKYGSMPTHAKYLHEMALRILLHALETSACRYRRHIVPVLSCGIDFYVRVFVRVFESPQEVKKACLRHGYVYQSVRCPSFHVQPVGKLSGHSFGGSVGPVCGAICAETGGSFRVGGPIWLEPLHDQAWVAEALEYVTAYKAAQDAAGAGAPLAFPPIETRDRMHGLLTTVSEELPDVPLYYTLPDLCQTLHCTSPKLDDIRSALINAGYRCSAFHKEPSALKTDAPNNVVWDIMRCWVAKHSPVASKRQDKEKSPGQMILAVPPTLEADFSRPKKVSLAKPKACRFPQNPEQFWGPKARARTTKHAPAAAEGASEGDGEGSGEPAAKQARREE